MSQVGVTKSCRAKKRAILGGPGSGWQGSKQANGRGSLVLSASSLARKKGTHSGAWTRGSWGWTYEGDDRPRATIGYEANLTDMENAWLRLHYRRNRRRWTNRRREQDGLNDTDGFKITNSLKTRRAKTSLGRMQRVSMIIPCSSVFTLSNCAS